VRGKIGRDKVRDEGEMRGKKIGGGLDGQQLNAQEGDRLQLNIPELPPTSLSLLAGHTLLCDNPLNCSSHLLVAAGHGDRCPRPRLRPLVRPQRSHWADSTDILRASENSASTYTVEARAAAGPLPLPPPPPPLTPPPPRSPFALTCEGWKAAGWCSEVARWTRALTCPIEIVHATWASSMIILFVGTMKL
jgi:hypothetical protein